MTTATAISRTIKIVSLVAMLQAASAMAATTGFDEGVRAFEGNNHAAALRIFRAEAEKGHAGAQYYLGRMHLLGEGVSTDYTRASEYFLAAANQDNVNAQFYLGTMYYRGVGVSQDYTKAFQWYRRAAAQGDGAAQFSLGVINSAGEGVPKNSVRALMWFNLAAQSGFQSAEKFKDLLKRSMTPDDIAEADRLARDRSRKPNTP